LIHGRDLIEGRSKVLANGWGGKIPRGIKEGTEEFSWYLTKTNLSVRGSNREKSINGIKKGSGTRSNNFNARIETPTDGFLRQARSADIRKRESKPPGMWGKKTVKRNIEDAKDEKEKDRMIVAPEVLMVSLLFTGWHKILCQGEKLFALTNGKEGGK